MAERKCEEKINLLKTVILLCVERLEMKEEKEKHWSG